MKEKRFCYANLTLEDLQFYTGITSKELFRWVLSMTEDESKIFAKSLTLEDRLLIVLMKLKLGLFNRDISIRFGIKAQVTSKIYRYYLPLLAKELAFLIVWPERDTLRKNLPPCFTSFKNCCVIIDCTEIYIERPSNLNARAQTWSNYKHTNTIKYLIGITPVGAVSFLSRNWSGKVSGKEITNRSKFDDFVQNGDMVMADHGFTIEKELSTRGTTLKIAAFTKNKKQMSAKDVHNSRKTSNACIHVERVIGRTKKFKIWNSIIPIKMVDLLDSVMLVIFALVSVNKCCKLTFPSGNLPG